MIATHRTNSGTDKREGYWTDPETGEQVKVLKSRPIHVIPTMTPDRFMLIGRDGHDDKVGPPVRVRM
jgi:hypothetical protein